MTDRNNYTLGDLISDLESSEAAYDENLRTAARIEATDGHNLRARGWRTQASLLRFQPDSALHPGIDAIEVLCDEWGTGLTSQNARRLRNKLFVHLSIDISTANKMSLEDTVAAIKTATNRQEGNNPTAKRPQVNARREENVIKPDVLVVTVNIHETQALHKLAQAASGTPPTPRSIDGRAYHDLGVINGTSVFHAVSEMGPASVGGMQQTVDKAIRALAPGAVVALGIAFGVSKDKQQIGDVLISKQIQPYDLAREGADIVLRDDRPHAAARLINHFTVFSQAKWELPVTPGLMLSGSKLIDNVDYRDRLVALVPEAVGGEMEASGLYVASHDHKVDWIVVKAICDWADGKKRLKKEDRQKQAASAAAEFFVASLKYSPLSERQNVSGDRFSSGKDREKHTWATGDFQIDAIAVQIGQYTPANDIGGSQLTELLRSLFRRRAFFPQPEGDWSSFAYVSSATRMLVQQAMSVVKDSAVRLRLRNVIKEISKLETVAQNVCGRQINLSRHAERFIHDKHAYVEELDRLVDWPSSYSDPKRMKVIQKGDRDRVNLISQLEQQLMLADLL